jgi:translation initiation factor IF-3
MVLAPHRGAKTRAKAAHDADAPAAQRASAEPAAAPAEPAEAAETAAAPTESTQN